MIVPTLVKYPQSAATVTEEVKPLFPSASYSCSNHFIFFLSTVCNVPLTSGKVVEVRPSFFYFDPSDRCQRYECFRNFSFSHTNLSANCPTLNCPAALQTLPMGKCCPVCMCKLLPQIMYIYSHNIIIAYLFIIRWSCSSRDALVFGHYYIMLLNRASRELSLLLVLLEYSTALGKLD